MSSKPARVSIQDAAAGFWIWTENSAGQIVANAPFFWVVFGH